MTAGILRHVLCRHWFARLWDILLTNHTGKLFFRFFKNSAQFGATLVPCEYRGEVVPLGFVFLNVVLSFSLCAIVMIAID